MSALWARALTLYRNLRGKFGKTAQVSITSQVSIILKLLISGDCGCS